MMAYEKAVRRLRDFAGMMNDAYEAIAGTEFDDIILKNAGLVHGTIRSIADLLEMDLQGQDAIDALVGIILSQTTIDTLYDDLGIDGAIDIVTKIVNGFEPKTIEDVFSRIHSELRNQDD